MTKWPADKALGIRHVVSDDFEFRVPAVDDVRQGWVPDALDHQWRWTLTNEQIDELVAVSATLDLNSDLRTLNPADYPLPSLETECDRLRQQLLTGRGFEVIRGLPVTTIGDEHATAAMVVLSTHLGPLRSQNGAGDLIGHVRNTDANALDPNVRLYQTNERQTFHTDSTDVVGLLALSTAAQGGESLVASARTVYHEMATRHRDLVDLLFEPIATDRRGETPDGLDPWFTIPVFTWWAKRLTVMYQRQYIDSAARFEDAPRLSSRQVAALDAFDDVCNDPSVHARMELAVGDMQFVHNHSILHDRNGFVDTPERPRHLIRTWLTVANDRPLHPVFAERFGSVTPGDRGGITTR